jgi:hypothetical protein
MEAKTMRSALITTAFLLFVCGCGERPQRVTKDSPAPAAAPAPKKAEKVVHFGGTIALEGSLAEVQTGAIFVSARRKGVRLPTLSHKYDMTGSGWSAQDGKRVLAFDLADEDNMAGFGAPMGAEMEVEARYSPSGFIDPKPGAEEPGVVRASVPAAPGDQKLAIKLQTTSGK